VGVSWPFGIDRRESVPVIHLLIDAPLNTRL
jgi:hypothetical protein